MAFELQFYCSQSCCRQCLLTTFRANPLMLIISPLRSSITFLLYGSYFVIRHTLSICSAYLLRPFRFSECDPSWSEGARRCLSPPGHHDGLVGGAGPKARVAVGVSGATKVSQPTHGPDEAWLLGQFTNPVVRWHGSTRTLGSASSRRPESPGSVTAWQPPLRVGASAGFDEETT